MNQKQALAILGFSEDFFDDCLRCRNQEEANERLEQLKKEAKSHWRRLCLHCHPDKGGDPATFRGIQEAWQIVKSTKVILPKVQKEERLWKFHMYNRWGIEVQSRSDLFGYVRIYS